jgi:8-oxo-dGTP diphosphatase
MLREVLEETGILLESVQYKGIVTWSVDGVARGGMYAFVADVNSDLAYETPLGTKEGIIDWKAIGWVLHPENTGVAANLPWFLPKMLAEDRLYEHACVFSGKTLVTVESVPME